MFAVRAHVEQARDGPQAIGGCAMQPNIVVGVGGQRHRQRLLLREGLARAELACLIGDDRDGGDQGNRGERHQQQGGSGLQRGRIEPRQTSREPGLGADQHAQAAVDGRPGRSWPGHAQRIQQEHRASQQVRAT